MFRWGGILVLCETAQRLRGLGDDFAQSLLPYSEGPLLAAPPLLI